VATLATPGVYVELTDAPADLNPVAVDVAALVGVFERGPLDRAVRITSWPQIAATFGGFVANGIGAYALKGWLDNGGRVAHVVRMAAPARVTTAIGPQPASRWSSVLGSLDGLVPGVVAALRQGDRTWMHVVGSADEATGTVTWDRSLHPDVDLLAPGAEVRSGAAPADATLAGEAPGSAILDVAAASPGAWGNHLSVRVAHEFGAATHSRAVSAPAAAATAVETTDGFAAGNVVRVSRDDGGGVLSERRLVASVDRAASVLGWDAPLIVVDPTTALRIEVESFSISIREGGRLREVFEGLTMVPGQPGYAPDALAASALVSVAPPPGPSPTVPEHPAASGWIALAAGRDGAAALAPADVLGDELAGVQRGLAVLALVDEPAIVLIPDLVAETVPARIDAPTIVEVDPCDPCPPPPPPPDTLVARTSEAGASFDATAIAAVQQAMIDHCERRADRIALLDPPAATGPLALSALTAWRDRSHSSYAAAYAPWLLVIDPLPGATSTLRRLPPSGHVAGLMASVDAEVGPWLAPANRVLRWTHATDQDIDDAGHGILNEAGIDVLRARSGRGVAVLGARTVADDASWRFVPVRRLFLALERTLRSGLAWTVFEPAGPALDRAMSATITGLLEGLWERGAFAGESPETSFFVHVGGGDRLAGEVIVEIGIAVQRPIERILLQVVRANDHLEIRELPDRSV
jgi:hypothetical protein